MCANPHFNLVLLCQGIVHVCTCMDVKRKGGREVGGKEVGRGREGEERGRRKGGKGGRNEEGKEGTCRWEGREERKEGESETDDSCVLPEVTS